MNRDAANVRTLLLAALALAWPAAAAAHGTGSGGAEALTQVVAGPDGVQVIIHVVAGERAAAHELEHLDGDGDGRISEQERAAWEKATAERIGRALALTVDDAAQPLRLVRLESRFPLGPAGRPEMRLQVSLSAPWPATPADASERRFRVATPPPTADVDHHRVRVSGKPRGAVRYRLERAGGPGGPTSPPSAVVAVYTLPE